MYQISTPSSARVLCPGMIFFILFLTIKSLSQQSTVINVPIIPDQKDVPQSSYNDHRRVFKAIARGGQNAYNYQWSLDPRDASTGYSIDPEVNTFTGNFHVKFPLYWLSNTDDPRGIPDEYLTLNERDGHPVDCSSRYFEMSEVEKRYRGKTMLSYNSGKTRRDGGCGTGVASFFDVCIKITPPVATVSREDGSDEVFTWDGTKYVPETGNYDSLSEYAPSLYRLRTKHGTRYFFDDPGHHKITSKIDRNGNITSFTYNSNDQLVLITFPNTRKIGLEYEDDHVVRILDKSAVPNRVTTLKYNIFDELIEISSPAGLYLSLTYGYWGNIKSMTDASGNTIFIDYNDNKAVSNISIPAADVNRSFSYDLFTRTTTVTDFFISGDLQTTRYVYDPDGRIAEIIYPDLSSEQYTYDLNNNILTYTNENLKTWTFSYDTRGNMTTSEDPNGNLAEWTYDPVYNLIQTYTNPDVFTTNYYYDLKGNLDSIKDPLAQKRSFTYNPHGNLLRYEDRNSFSTKFTYNGFFDLIVERDAFNYVKNYYYDPWGNITLSKDKLNRSTTYKYDDNNRLIKIVNPALDSMKFHPPESFFDITFDLVINETGDSIRFDYNAAGMLVRVTDPLKRVTEYDYDEVCNLAGIKDPEGNSAYFEYDSRNRLVKATDFSGGIEQFDYDPAGNLTLYLNKNNYLTNFTYDDANRLVAIQDYLGNPETFGYDPAGNWTQYTDQRLNTYQITYDELNRMTAVIDPESNAETAGYDAEGMLITLTDRNSNSTNYTYDLLYRLIQVTDPKGFYEFNGYNSVGNLMMHTDKNGNQTLYGYDLLDRLTTITNAGGDKQVLTYDKRNNRVSWKDNRGYTTYYEYDKADQMVLRRDAKGEEDLFSYNLLGLKTLHTDRRGKTTQYSYDPMGRLLTVTDALTNTESHAYDAEGNDTLFTDKNGNQTRIAYDGLNRATNVRDALLNPEFYFYDPAGNRTALINRNGQGYNFYYNKLNRQVKTTDPQLNSDSITYDPSGRITELIDAGGNKTSYLYDCCNLVQITDPLGFTQIFVHDSAGNVIKSFDKRGLLTRTEYDNLNRPVKIIDTLGNYLTRAYDANGHNILNVNKNGDSTKYVYDELGRLAERVDPYGNSYLFGYDETGNMTSVEDRNAHITLYSYDDMNRMVKVTDPLTYHEDYIFDAAGNLKSRVNKNSDTVKYNYDPLHRVISMTDPALNSEYYAYDNVGNLISRQDRGGNLTLYLYDAADRLTKITDAKGHFSTRAYDAEGNIIQITDRDNHPANYQYDALGRLTQYTDAMLHAVKYFYDANGNLIQFKDGNNNSRFFQYDSLNRMEKAITQLGFQTQWFYDPAGNLLKRVTPSLDTTLYEYNRNHRLTKTTYPGGRTITNTYDAEMNLLRVSGNGVLPDTTLQVYDAGNRITSIQRKYGNLFSKTSNYTYNKVGRRTGISQGSDQTLIHYNSLGLIDTIIGPQGDTSLLTYNANGMRTGLILGNGTGSSYVYDNTNYLTSLNWFESDGDLIVNYNYNYDFEGNRIDRTEIYPTGTFTTFYSYFTNDWLANVNTSWGYNASYLYDGAGNRLNKTENGLVTTYTYDADNRLVYEASPTGPINYTFNNNGNLVSKVGPAPPDVTSYFYDYENRLKQVIISSGPTVDYDYFSTGQRMSRTASPTVYYNYTCSYCPVCCQWYCTLDYQYDDTGNTTESYTSGPFTDEHLSQQTGTGTNYYVTDGIGTVSMMTDELENVVASWEYGPFGDISYEYGISTNPFNFQGKEYDDITAQYNYVNRQYDPFTGRFTTQDPLFSGQLSGCDGGCSPFRITPFSEGPDAHTGRTAYEDQTFGPGSDPFDGIISDHQVPGIMTGSMNNLYSFVNNNPATYIDPLGLSYMPAMAREILNHSSPVNPWNGLNDQLTGTIFSKPPAHLEGHCDGCKDGGACSCGSFGLLNYNSTRGPWFIEPYGQTSCDLNKPSCSDFDTKINNTTCTRECTERHEEQHQKDMKSCCDKGRDAYANVLKKWEDIYRSRGLGEKTLKKKLDNLENDPNVRADRRVIMTQYNNYSGAASRWTECNADQVSITCADELWKRYKCDCPPPENKQCCKDIEHYKKVAKARQKAKKCPETGGPPTQEPPCPF